MTEPTFAELSDFAAAVFGRDVRERCSECGASCAVLLPGRMCGECFADHEGCACVCVCPVSDAPCFCEPCDFCQRGESDCDVCHAPRIIGHFDNCEVKR